jgi:hypothetical protein
MKKFVAVIVAVASIAASTSIANAGGTNAPGGSIAAANYNSVFNGTVSGTCALAVVDGDLPTNQGFGRTLTSPIVVDSGLIGTVCNTTTSKLKVELVSGSAPPQANYTEQFTVTPILGAYVPFFGTATRTGGPIGPTSFSANAREYTNLSNRFSRVPSVLAVRARGSVPVGRILAAGTYTINVKATVTP